MDLSVIIPVYNEKNTIKEIIRRVQNQNLVGEIILIDDGSTDGTREILESVSAERGIKVIFHKENQGKGSAVRSGLDEAKGEIILIQDADLEYDPRDYPHLIKPIEEGITDVVYGSRFLGAPRLTAMFWHMVANKLLTFITNILYDTILSDMETGYKVFRRNVIWELQLKSKRFNFEPEFTAKILKRGYRVYEVPIRFVPRDYDEGKKIGMKDAFEAVWTLLKYRFVD